MNILVIGKFDAEAFGLHISETLHEMGHDVVQFQKGIKYWHFRYQALNRLNSIKLQAYRLLQNSSAFQKSEIRSLKKTLQKNSVGGIDFAIVTHDFLTPNEVVLIKEITRSPICMWFPDHIAGFGRSMFLNASYDALFFKDPYQVYVLSREVKKNIYYLPECCNPLVHKIAELNSRDAAKYNCDITTAGNFYANRAAVFEQLSQYNFNIKLWGNPPSLWMNVNPIVKRYLQGEYVINDKKSMAFQGGKIVINNLHPAEIWGLNCRAFEIPAVGGFQLVSWRPGIKDLFKEGAEIETYQNFDELLEKINFYLLNDEKRRSIIDAGHRRVYADHTYKNRLEIMIDVLFNNGKGYALPNINLS